MSRQAASVFSVLVIVCVLPSAAQPPEASSEVNSTPAAREGENPTDDLRSSPSLLIRGWPDALLGKLVPEGMKYGVGATAFFENQTSLESTLARTTITLRDLDRNVTDTRVFTEDPRLTNTKLDFELELKGAGILVPVGLPQIPNTGTVSIYPTFFFELTAVDVGFDVFDTTTQPAQPLGTFEAVTLDTGFDAFAAAQQAINSSSQGNGPMFGLGLDLTARVCSSCKWIANWSYWYRFIPSLDVDRPLGLFPDFEAAFDSLSLTREAHEVSSRVGYAVSAGSHRYVPFTGVLYKRTKLELEDEVRFLDPLIGLETTLESFSRFESETVQALAGFDVQLSNSVFGRLETAFGEGDYGVSFQITWSKGPPPKLPKFPKREKKQTRVINSILEQLRQLRRDFLREWDSLPVITSADGSPAYSTREVRSLLERSRDRFLEILSYRQLVAMQNYVADEIDDILSSLSGESVPVVGIAQPEIRVASSSALASGGFVLFGPETSDETSGVDCNTELCRNFSLLVDKIIDVFLRGVEVNLEIRTCPSGALVDIYTLTRTTCKISKPTCKRFETKDTYSDNTLRMFRGKYRYTVEKDGYSKVHCNASSSCDTSDPCDKCDACCRKLNLIDQRGSVFQCELHKEDQGFCVLKEVGDLQCPGGEEPNE